MLPAAPLIIVFDTCKTFAKPLTTPGKKKASASAVPTYREIYRHASNEKQEKQFFSLTEPQTKSKHVATHKQHITYRFVTRITNHVIRCKSYPQLKIPSIYEREGHQYSKKAKWEQKQKGSLAVRQTGVIFVQHLNVIMHAMGHMHPQGVVCLLHMIEK